MRLKICAEKNKHSTRTSLDIDCPRRTIPTQHTQAVLQCRSDIACIMTATQRTQAVLQCRSDI